MDAAGELLCTVTQENLATSGVVLKRSVHKNIILTLGRNEHRDLILKFDLGKRHCKYRLSDIQLHKKFAKDGKATIKLPQQQTQFMLSNCPPDKLIMFLKIMTTKLELLKKGGMVSTRVRLLSDKPRAFEDISPLTMNELQSVHNMRANVVEKNTDIFTPKGKVGMKRKRQCEAQENRQAKVSKLNTQASPSLSQKRAQLGKKHVLNPVVLTKEQNKVLQTIISGRSVFFTGSAGTGKSFLLKRIIGALAPQYTFATASTGVAACHIGGTTLHAFAGIGSGKAAIEQCIELASRQQVAQQWRKCKHLIIDEISMVDGELFDKLEIVARVMKKSDKPFGGIQLILCGDFLQLPPVTKRGEQRKFAFQSKTWNTCIDVSMELTNVKRQNDPKFINILQNIRRGVCTQEDQETLLASSRNPIDKDGILATRLCTHKDDVDQINLIHLQKIKCPSRLFEATDSDPGLQKTIDAQCPVPAKLELKIGAQVMLAKNLNVEQGLVNGARGVVSGFEAGALGVPIVTFMCGETTRLQHERWTFKAAGGVYLSRRQLPLKLAWAISIHKSQGMSLDCVEISLSKVFESGQSYVALSRARSLRGLRVLDFNRGCVRADPHVLKFYRQLREEAGVRRSEATSGSQGAW